MTKKTKTGKREMNPTDAYRKQVRKKELKKNKKDRQRVREITSLKRDPTKLKEELDKMQTLNQTGELSTGLQKKYKQLRILYSNIKRSEKEQQQVQEQQPERDDIRNIKDNQTFHDTKSEFMENNTDDRVKNALGHDMGINQTIDANDLQPVIISPSPPPLPPPPPFPPFDQSSKPQSSIDTFPPSVRPPFPPKMNPDLPFPPPRPPIQPPTQLPRHLLQQQPHPHLHPHPNPHSYPHPHPHSHPYAHSHFHPHPHPHPQQLLHPTQRIPRTRTAPQLLDDPLDPSAVGYVDRPYNLKHTQQPQQQQQQQQQQVYPPTGPFVHSQNNLYPQGPMNTEFGLTNPSETVSLGPVMGPSRPHSLSGQQKEVEKPKPKPKVSAELLAFVPSSIRVKRSGAVTSTTPSLSTVISNPNQITQKVEATKNLTVMDDIKSTYFSMPPVPMPSSVTILPRASKAINPQEIKEGVSINQTTSVKTTGLVSSTNPATKSAVIDEYDQFMNELKQLGAFPT